MKEENLPDTITLGRGKKRRTIPIVTTIHYLSEEENDARLNRLARKIIRLMNESNQRDRKRQNILQDDFSQFGNI